jgi:ribosomal subunit interface protein
MEIGDALMERAKDACSSLAVKYGTTFLEANIVMKKENYLFCCDISVKTSLGEVHHAGSDADDPHVSFDGALQKIDQQIRRKKRNCRSSCKVGVPNPE